MPNTQQVQTNTEEQDFILSANPNKAIQEMMDSIDVLRKVYIRETEALVAADSEKFLSLQEEKLGAARNYESGIEQILARKDEIKMADPSLKNRLEDMQKDFARLADKNLDALGRMSRTLGRLGNSIRNAARETAAQQRAVSYGKDGTIHKAERKTISTGLSETA